MAWGILDLVYYSFDHNCHRSLLGMNYKKLALEVKCNFASDDVVDKSVDSALAASFENWWPWPRRDGHTLLWPLILFFLCFCFLIVVFIFYLEFFFCIQGSFSLSVDFQFSFSQFFCPRFFQLLKHDTTCKELVITKAFWSGFLFCLNFYAFSLSLTSFKSLRNLIC